MSWGDVIGSIVVIAVIFALTYGGSYISSLFYANARYDVTVIVQAVEKSSRFGMHTNLWAQVYGEQDITYNLIGYHDFEIGETYRIEFVDKVVFTIVGFKVRGKVIETELISK